MIELFPGARATRGAAVDDLGEQRGSPYAAVRVLLPEALLDLVAAGEAVSEILQEVSAENHVDPRVTAAVQTGQQRRQSDGRVLRI